MSYLADKEGISPYYIEDLGRKISFFSDIRAFYKILKILYREKPDIVHTHKSKAGLLGRIAAYLLRVPFVLHTFHGHIFHGYFSKFKTSLFLYIERFLALLTDKILVISQKQYEEICFTYRIAPCHKFSIVPLGFDFTALENAMNTRDSIRQEWGVLEEEKAIGIVARLTAIKNHRLFLDAAKQVLLQGKKAKFIIVGDGEDRGMLEEYTKTLGIQKNVFFTGWIEDRSKIYPGLDIVALTSRNEGTPVTLIEALFCSKPVVATKVGGVSDVVQEGKNGLLVPSEDIQALTKAFIFLLENPAESNKMGENGHQDIENRYSAKRLLKDIDEIYSSFHRKS